MTKVVQKMVHGQKMGGPADSELERYASQFPKTKPFLSFGDADQHIAVSVSSSYTAMPGGAMAFAWGTYNLPLVTGDIAVIVRDELDKSPLSDRSEDRCLDMSQLNQALSLVALYYLNEKGEDCLLVTDYSTAYGDDLDKQIAAAQKIGKGIVLPKEDSLLHDLFVGADFSRNVNLSHLWKYPPLGSSKDHNEYAVPLQQYTENPLAHAFFPRETERNTQYLQRKKRTADKFSLFSSGVYQMYGLPYDVDRISDGKDIVVMPVFLCGAPFFGVWATYPFTPAYARAGRYIPQ